MVRVALLVLVILVGYDHVVNDGRFSAAAVQASVTILHHFGMT